MMPARDRGDIVLPGSPMESLVRDLEEQVNGAKHQDFLHGQDKKYTIKPDGFVEIKTTKNPRRIAFVDGGNNMLVDAPSFSIIINRVYFSMFRGDKRETPKTKTRVEFFSSASVRMHTENGRRKVRYNIKTYPVEPEDARYLPDEESLCPDKKDTRPQEQSEVDSPARRFAELRTATHVVKEELGCGDILIIDGSLQTSLQNEYKYADELYSIAQKKGVIVCGLAKTSRLLTESGGALLTRVAEISKKTDYGRWYVKVADEAAHGSMGVILVAKFHPNAEFIFRFDILRDQFKEMSQEEINSVLASIAANSEDLSMLGYPYAAVDADRFAQVRLSEHDVYRNMILTEATKIPGWEDLYSQCKTIAAHSRLNEVTS